MWNFVYFLLIITKHEIDGLLFGQVWLWYKWLQFVQRNLSGKYFII